MKRGFCDHLGPVEQARALYPLNKMRGQQPCPWPGKYRLIDISRSATASIFWCQQIYVLTPVPNSASLNGTSNPDLQPFSAGFGRVLSKVLAAQQTPDSQLFEERLMPGA